MTSSARAWRLSPGRSTRPRSTGAPAAGIPRSVVFKGEGVAALRLEASPETRQSCGARSHEMRAAHRAIGAVSEPPSRTVSVSVSANREPKPTPRKDLSNDRRRIPAAVGGPPIRPHQPKRRPGSSHQLRLLPPSRSAQPRQRRAVLLAGLGGAQPPNRRGRARRHPSTTSTSRGCLSPPCRRARRISISSSPRSPLPTRWSPNTPISARCWRRAPGPISSG